MRHLPHVIATLAVVLFTACDNPYHPDSSDDNPPTQEVPATKGNFTITIAAPEQSDYNESSEAQAPHTIKWQQPLRSKREVSEVCSRLSIAVYTHSGNSYSKVNEVSQQRDDKNFGTTSLTLAQGTYTIVAIAHNGDGKPTMTDPKKIPFANNKVTDTFYATEEIVVGENTTTTLHLNRAVAMINFCTTDNTPADITTMQFYYTGGSSTFNAIDGYGCVKSKQNEKRSVKPEFHNGQSSYELFTFPHQDATPITLTVTALDNNSNHIFEHKFSDISVAVNYKTNCHGTFFGEDPEGGRVAPSITINDEWKGEKDYTFDTTQEEFETEK